MRISDDFDSLVHSNESDELVIAVRIVTRGIFGRSKPTKFEIGSLIAMATSCIKRTLATWLISVDLVCSPSSLFAAPRIVLDKEGFIPQNDELGVAGMNVFQRRLMIQFTVDGSEQRPFGMCACSTSHQNDEWPPIEPPPEPKGPGSFSFPRTETGYDAKCIGSARFTQEQLVVLEKSLKKAADWIKISKAEGLRVSDKPLAAASEAGLEVTFTAQSNSPRHLINFTLNAQSGQGVFPGSTTIQVSIDERGVDRFLQSLSSLKARRAKYLEHIAKKEEYEARRRAKDKLEKQRADELLK